MAVKIVALILEDWRDILLVPRVQRVKILVQILMMSMSLGPTLEIKMQWARQLQIQEAGKFKNNNWAW